MSLSVKTLIDRYSELQQLEETSSDFKLEGELASLGEEEQSMLAALNMGVVVEKVLKERRDARML